MEKTTKTLVDPFHNIYYGSLISEQKTMFIGSMMYPFNIECIGITNPDKDYSISRVSSDYYTIEFVLDGKGYLTVQDKTYTLGEGDVYILPPESKHCYHSDYTTPYRKIWCNFFSNTFTKVLADYHLDKEYVFHAPECKEDFFTLLDIAQYSSGVNDDEWAKVASILLSIIGKIAAKFYHPNENSELATRVKEILDNSIYKNLTIEELCRTLYVSKMTLTKEFKKKYGITPYSYYLSKKITQAKLMLRSTITIKEISNKLCFTDEHYFSGLFKQKVGVSPSDFRKKLEAYLNK